MPEPTLAQVLTALEATNTALDATNAELETSREEAAVDRRYSRRSRLGLWFDGAATVVALVASVVAGIAFSKGSENHATQVASCKAGNQFRTQDHERWNHILDSVLPASEVARFPEVGPIRSAIEANNNKADKLRDCAAIK